MTIKFYSSKLTSLAAATCLATAPMMSKAYEVEAAYTAVANNEVVWTTTAQDMPTVTKDAADCWRVPEYMDGSLCIKVCGGSLTALPVSFVYEFRPSFKGHASPWEACNAASGCLGYSEQYYSSAQRGCGHFRISSAHPGQRDLRIRIKLGQPVPTARAMPGHQSLRSF